MIHFLLPVLNEAENLPRLAETIADCASQVNGLDFEIVAVDDGSTDGSWAVLEDLKRHFPVFPLRHARNLGPGAAFRTGFDAVLKKADSGDFLITMDADNTHDIRTVKEIVAALRNGYDAAIASVYAPGGGFQNVPWLRVVLSHACNSLYRTFFPMRGVREYTGFYRGYRVEALRAAREKLGGDLFTAPGFGAMAELLIRLRRARLRMTEVPMIVRYAEKRGTSKMRILRTVREHLRIIGKNAFRKHVG